MSCHICDYWTPEKGCAHYGPRIGVCHYKPLPVPAGLTPEQRIEAYEYALDRVHNVDRPYICILLREWTFCLRIFTGPDILLYFPEFAKYKPAVLPFEGYTMWWPEQDIATRMYVLRQCIKECLLLIKPE